MAEHPDLAIWRALAGADSPARVEAAIESQPAERRGRARRLALALARGGPMPPPDGPPGPVLEFQAKARDRVRSWLLPALRQWAESQPPS